MNSVYSPKNFRLHKIKEKIVNKEYDIYILSTTYSYYPYITIIFGDKWNTIFNKFKFNKN